MNNKDETTTQQEGLESITNEVGGEALSNSEIISSIASKIEADLRRIWPIRKIVFVATQAAHLAIQGIPFAYKQAKQTFGLVSKDLERGGMEYKFDSAQLILETIGLLKAKGEFTKEEAEFLDKNKVAIKRIIEITVRDGGVQDESREDLAVGIPQIYRGLSRVVRRFMDTQIKTKHAVLPEYGERIEWDKMNELQLLDTDIFELAEAAKKQPRRVMKQAQYKTEEERTSYYKRTFNIPSKIPKEKVEELIEQENIFLNKMNKIWIKIMKYFFDDDKDISACDFPERVKNAKDIFELFEILGEIRDTENLTEEKLHEINSARIKLIIYLAGSNLVRDVRYKKKKSCKDYIDDYLTSDVIKIIGRKKMAVFAGGKRGEVVRRKQEDEPVSCQVSVWKAILTDPETGEEIEVLLYEGGDSEHEDEEKTGVVNIKGLEKLIIKYLSERKYPIDRFRTTVTPLESSIENLGKVDRMLSKTVAHPQSRDVESMIRTGKNNSSSAYGSRNIEKHDIRLCPYVVTSKGEILSGFTRDVLSGDQDVAVETGVLPLELRVGIKEDILMERLHGHELNHRAYSQIRNIDAFSKLLPPNHYDANWLGRARRKVKERISSLEDQGMILPGFVQTLMQRFRRTIATTLHQ